MINKYQFLSLLLAVLVGAGACWYFTKDQNDKKIRALQEQQKKELKQHADSLLIVISNRDKRINKLDSIVRQDSIKILSFEKRIEQDGVRIEQLRKDAKKFTPSEKSAWLINRYK